MEVYRISLEKWSNKLVSSGSSNRWNKKGQHVIYSGSSRALSTLELIVHRSSIMPLASYKVMVIEIPDAEISTKEIIRAELPGNWRSMAAYSTLQNIGAEWYEQKKYLALKVPSAIIPQEYNYVINTEHPLYKNGVKLLNCEPYFWDSRLIL